MLILHEWPSLMMSNSIFIRHKLPLLVKIYCLRFLLTIFGLLLYRVVCLNGRFQFGPVWKTLRIYKNISNLALRYSTWNIYNIVLARHEIRVVHPVLKQQMSSLSVTWAVGTFQSPPANAPNGCTTCPEWLIVSACLSTQEDVWNEQIWKLTSRNLSKTTNKIFPLDH